MAGNIKGITLEIDGNVQGLDKALKQVNKELKGSQNELKQVEKALKLDPKNTELLAQKQKLLNDVFEQNKTKLKSLKDAKKQADEAMKNGTEVNEQEYRRLQREISLTASEIKKMGNAVKQEGLEQIGNGAKNITKGFATIGVAVAGASASLLALAESTREYREDMAKLQAGFQTAGFSAEQATSTYKSFFAVLGEEDRSVEAVNHLAKLTSSQEELNKWTDICTGVWGTFGDSLPIEGLTEAANETAKVGKVTGPLADALNWAGVSEDDFNAKLEKCNSEQERASMITETLNGLYSEAAEKYKTLNKDVMDSQRAQSELTDAMAQLGAVSEPIMTTLKSLAADLLQNLTPFVTDIMSSIQQWIEDNRESIQNVVDNIAEFIKTLVENGDLVVGLITTIGTAFLTWNVVTMISGVITTIKGLTMATEAQSTAQALLNVIMSANPIGIIITAVAALTAGFIYLWNNCEGFRNFFINMWEKIKEVALACADAIKTAWNAVVNFFTVTIPNLVNSIIGWFQNCWNTVVNSINNFITTLKGAVQKIVDVGLNFVKGLWQGISDSTQWLLNKIKEWCGSILNGVKAFFGIKSPSKVFREQIGRMLPKGMALGIQDGQTEVEKALNELNGSVVSIEQNLADEQKKIYDAMSKDFSSYVDNVANKFDELGEAQKNWTSKLRDGISLINEYTYQKTDGGGYRYSKGGVTVKSTKLADLSQTITDTKNWNAKVQSLKALLPAELFKEISSGNIQDVTSFMSAFFSASASEQQKFINDWEELQKVTNEASKAIYSEEVKQTRDEFISAFSQTPQEFFGIGEEAATQFGSAFMEKLSEVLKGMKISVNKTANSILPSEQRQIVINQNISGYASSPYEVAKETSLMFRRLEKGLAM